MVDETTMSVDELRQGRDELAAAIPSLEKAVTSSSSLEATRAAFASLEDAERAITKADTAIASAEFAVHADERIEAIANVSMQLTTSPDVQRAFELGVSQFIVTTDEDGNITVSDKQPGRGGKRGGGGKGRNAWIVNGNSYTSRELLEAFYEDEYGPDAMAKVWEARENGAGFDAPVKKLAKQIGAEMVAAPAKSDDE